MREEIREEILLWKDVKEKPNKFGTPSFFVNNKEFAHFHSDTQMDIRKPQNFKLKDKRMGENPFSDSWFHFNFKNKKDVEDMVKIVKQIYEQLYGQEKQGQAKVADRHSK